MAGENLLTIAEILGHRTLTMVKRYSHLNTEHKAVALNRLQKGFNIFPENQGVEK